MKIIHILILILFILSGCRREEPLHPFKWRPAGGEFDTLCEKLEWQLNEYAPFDSIRASVESLERLSRATETDNTLKQSRTYYWKAKYLSRIGHSDSAIKILEKALALNDSVKYRYDFLRIKVLIAATDETTDGAEEYHAYNKFLEYARTHDDKASEAMASIYMGNLFRIIGEFEKAIYYLNRSDNLNEEIGFHKFTIKNKINQALLLRQSGQRGASDSILKAIVNHPAIKEDKPTHNLILRNLFTSTGDISYIREAAECVENDKRMRHLKGINHAYMAEYYFSIGDTDSAILYSDMSLRELPDVTGDRQRASILYIASLSMMKQGKMDSAYIYRVRYDELEDSLQTKQRGKEIIKLSALREAGLTEARYTREIYKRNMIFAVIAIVLIATGGALLFLLNRRHLRQKIAAMETEMALEKTKRKITASTLTIQEKDNVLGVLKEELSEMRREGTIADTNARRLESTIKMHLSEKESADTFTDMFDIVNPVFTRRLHDRCGDMADSYVKLACYILMGLDNKKIGRLMMIKPESVRQARWRLRQKMRLAEDESMEDILRRMNDPQSNID